MKSNLFKSNNNSNNFEKREKLNNNQIKNNNSDNKFKNSFNNSKLFIQEEKKFNLNELYFPELGNSETKKENNKYLETKDKTNYAEVSKKEVEIITNKKYIQPGWSVIYKNEHGNLMIENGEKTENQIIRERNEKLLSNITNNVFNKLVENWEKYKAEFIDIYGEDEYEKTYLMPNYENMPEPEYEEFDNEDIDENDSYYIDDYEDYYY